MRQSRIIMGTGVSLDIPAARNEEIFNKVFDLLKEIDKRLSPYKKDSDLSKYQRGEIKLTPELKKIKDECEKYEKLTNGYFSANFSNKFDPTGYVKGWAIDRAGELLEKFGYDTFCISIGGDILAKSDGSKKWNIGIQDPRDPSKLLDLSSNFEVTNKPAPYQNLSVAVGNRIVEHQVFGAGLSIFSGAVATSGSYERGQHIINPKTGQPATDLLSVTVAGPDIIKADVLATAAFAAGSQAKHLLEKHKHYQSIIITKV